MGCSPSSDPSAKDDKQWTTSLAHDAAEDRQLKKLLLLGPGNSGKSTFFKQLLKIHGDGFSDPKRFATADIKRSIYDSIIAQMRAIIQQCDEFEYQLAENEQKSVDYISALPRDVDMNPSIAHHISTLWSDQSILDSFEHRTNLGIVDSCPHFFNSIDRISQPDYQPTEEDILLARTPTTGVVSSSFDVSNHRFMIFDVGGQRSERNKWIHCFDSVTAVLFVASLSCYDQALFELDYVNAMQEALNLYDEITNSRWFKRTAIILFLNKVDLFKIKIEKKDLRVCFPQYSGANHFKEGVEFIRKQFLDKNENKKGQQLYSHITCATDRDNVAKVFNDVQHIVVNLSLQRGGLL